MQLNHYFKALKLSSDVQWVGLREVIEKKTVVTARNGAFDKISTHLDHGFMIEVFINGQFGYAATNTNNLTHIQEALNKAITLARQAAFHKIHSFSLDTRPAVSGHYQSLFQKPLSSASLNDIVEVLVSATNTLKVSDIIINANATAIFTDKETRMLSSHPTEICQQLQTVSLGFLATAAKNNQIQTRTNGAFDLQIGLEIFNTPQILHECSKIGEQALELIDAKECPTGQYDLVLEPDQMNLQVHESIGHPLELDRILGDERNYAGSSFVKPSDFGSLRYGSSLLNVTFDPTQPHELASYAFDEIGNPATCEYLIKDGILLQGLGSLESQERLNLPGVANMRGSSWNRPPIDRIGNVNVEPGNSSFEEMISQIDYGIYMETNRSWSIDDYRHKFQFGCEYAREIKNGKLGVVLKNPNYRGKTIPFWNQLKAVGNLKETKITGTSFCGKGEPNQLIQVGHRVPTCHFSNIEVFGGGK